MAKSCSMLTEVSVQALRFIIYQVSSLTSDPFFSTIATFYLLILLYLPRHLISLLFSPVPISTFILIAALVHFGSNHAPQTHQEPKREEPISAADTEPGHLGFNQKQFFPEPFVEWGRRGTLEVIYEDYEWEEEDGREGGGGGRDSPESSRSPVYGSLGLLFTDSDSESESGGESPDASRWMSPENRCFQWEEELIEIRLEDDENLIEIDISGCCR